MVEIMMTDNKDPDQTCLNDQADSGFYSHHMPEGTFSHVVTHLMTRL